MANIMVSTLLCNYIVSSQQKDLFVIFENFSDEVKNPDNNIFFRQNEILDKMLLNIENCKKSVISHAGLYKGISNEEKEIIEDLEVDKRIFHDYKYSKNLGIIYFDKELFLKVLNDELNEISTKYNLNGDDDYNKLYNFLYSIKLNLNSSDDVLLTLSNQYTFYKEHSQYCVKENEQEYISIYGNKIYKEKILSDILNKYNNKININNKKTNSR